MDIWGWYTLIGLATAIAAVAYFGQTSDAIAQEMPEDTDPFEFTWGAITTALLIGVAWPLIWAIMYDKNRPKN